MIETLKPSPIFERILDLCRCHDHQSRYQAQRVYLGSKEWEELIDAANEGFPNVDGLGKLEHYRQGTAQVFGLSIFVIKDTKTHLAIA